MRVIVHPKRPCIATHTIQGNISEDNNILYSFVKLIYEWLVYLTTLYQVGVAFTAMHQKNMCATFYN